MGSVTSPTIIPPIDPIRTAAQTPDETPKYLTRTNDATINTTAEPIVPNLKAISGLLSENNRTSKMPIIEQIRPKEARAKGINCNMYWSPPSFVIVADVMDAANAIDAIIDPQYDSKISEPIPATSPTLSPTLSAITPGFLGSSSGMPASTLPTRSAPTSALLVKIPPPTRENKATEEATIANPSIE